MYIARTMIQAPRTRSHAFAALLILEAASVACASRGRAQEPAPGRDLAASLDDYFARQFPADEPGGAVLVQKRERVVFAHGYGLADLKTREPVTTRTLFNLGSISKTFVANAILVLQEQGRLSVEDPLLRYFPGFKSHDIASRVQLKHMLTHSSGLPDNREVHKNTAFYLTAKDAENWYPVTQADALVFDPGSRFAYSNPAFNGLALIVEQVSGMKWQAFVHDRIFVPAGMLTSTITDGAHPEAGVAHAYLRDTGPWSEADYGEIPTFAAAGNGGVWSSVEELARYELALRHGAFLRPETVADSRTVKTFRNWNAPEPPIVGWSWFIEQTPEHLRTIGHEGSQGGFQCSYVTIPDKDVFFAILTNTPRDEQAFVRRIVQELAAASWLD